MLDTVKVKLSSGNWRPLGKFSECWQTREATTVEAFEVVEGQYRERATGESIFRTNLMNGLRVWGTSQPLFVEASLPRLVFSHNGQLLKSDVDLAQAKEALLDVVGEVVEGAKVGNVTRLDTVWQYRGDPPSWIQAIATARWRGVRKEPRLFFHQSVEFVGSTQVMRAYDKQLELGLGPGGQVVRIEHQSRSKLLSKPEFKHLRSWDNLTIENLYPHYRAKVIEIPAFRVADFSKGRGLTITEFLAFLASEGVKVRGIAAQEYYLQHRAASSQREIRRKVAAAEARSVLEIDLATLLPETSLPEVVNVEAKAF